MFFKKKDIKEEKREEIIDETYIEEPLLRALLGKDYIDRDEVLNIPEVEACINKIGDTVAGLEIKLYEKNNGKIVEIKDDKRTVLLNEDTGDTLNAYQMKKAMVTDMYLGRGGYAFINKKGNEIKSIHYVEENRIGFRENTDPIFKDYQIQVNGKYYEGFRFIKLLRNTKNGYKGKSIVEENKLLLVTVLASQKYEKNLVKTGGNKKGFIKSARKLSKEAMAQLKETFKRLYKNNSENVVVLNEGLDFMESSNTSVEMQMNENKKTNGENICKIFLVPPPIINGGATEEDIKQYIEGCIMSIINNFTKAINSVMLNEDEKRDKFFAFDITDLVKGDIEKRYKAFKIAIDSGFMQVDEIREKENLPAFGLDFIKLGLQDVIYYPKTNEIYTPNTNKLSKMGESQKINEKTNKKMKEIIGNMEEGVENEN